LLNETDLKDINLKLFELQDVRKENCNNLDSRYKQLVLTLALEGKLDPGIPLPNQCRQILSPR
jgi:hypothetical protein